MKKLPNIVPEILKVTALISTVYAKTAILFINGKSILFLLLFYFYL